MRRFAKTLPPFNYDTILPLLVIVILTVSLVANASTLVAEYQASDPGKTSAVESQVELGPDVGAVLILAAPETAQVGDLIEVSCEGSCGASFKWSVEGVKEGNFRIVDEGHRALIAADQEGTIVVCVATACDDTVDMKKILIRVTAGDPRPGPASDSLEAKISQAMALVKTDNKKEQRIALASAFANIANLIETGMLKTPEEVLDVTKTFTREAILPNLSDWQPVVSVIETHLGELVQAGKLTTMDDHARAWRKLSEAM